MIATDSQLPQRLHTGAVLTTCLAYEWFPFNLLPIHSVNLFFFPHPELLYWIQIVDFPFLPGNVAYLIRSLKMCVCVSVYVWVCAHMCAVSLSSACVLSESHMERA